MSAAVAFLRPARHRPNLTIVIGAHVTRLRIEGGIACGVDYIRRGRPCVALVSREVVVAAGAIETPHLLMLSGIGPADHLHANDIEPIVDLPGVGANFHDHIGFSLLTGINAPISLYGNFSFFPGIASGIRYLIRRTGPLSEPPVEAVGVFRSGEKPDIGPDFKLSFIPLMIEPREGLLRRHGCMTRICMTKPASRGSIRLRSGSAGDPPLIDARYLERDVDLRRLRAGVRVARDIMAQPAFDAVRGEEVVPPGGVRTDAAQDRFLRASAEPDYHGAGSCRMGGGALAVVDETLRVHGVQGLRIADASVMPVVPSGNTNAPVMMIAEKAVDMLLGRRPLPSAALSACLCYGEQGVSAAKSEE